MKIREILDRLSWKNSDEVHVYFRKNKKLSSSDGQQENESEESGFDLDALQKAMLEK